LILDSLKKGLHTLRNQVQERKSRIKLKSDQKAHKVISESDEDWLDGEGNLVDKERVVQDLEEASNYERGLGRLDAEGRGIVQKLQVLGGGHSAAIGKKHKHTKTSHFFEACSLSHKYNRFESGKAGGGYRTKKETCSHHEEGSCNTATM
jgi:hypothetical protein